MTVNDEAEKLYTKVFSVCMKDEWSSESRSHKITITVEQPANAALRSQETLSIRLTDKDDPFFLYVLKISEEDFQIIKKQQDLLVDLYEFPKMLIDLLDMCYKEESKMDPKYILAVDVCRRPGPDNSVKLSVVEKNPFKHIVHLSLKLALAGDLELKHYFTMRYQKLKDESGKLESKLQLVENEYKSKLIFWKEEDLRRNEQIELLRKELLRKEKDYQQEINKEKEVLLKNQRDEEEREKERNEKISVYSHRIQELQANVKAMDAKKKDVEKQNILYENKLKEFRNNLKLKDEENKQLQSSLSKMKEERDKCLQEIDDKNRAIQKLECDYSHLEISAAEESREYLCIKEKLEEAIQEKELLLEDMKYLKNTLLEMEQVKVELTNSNLKSHDVIKKLQEEAQVSHLKLNERDVLVIKLEEEKIAAEDEISNLLNHCAESEGEAKKLQVEKRHLSEMLQAENEMRLIAETECVRLLNDIEEYRKLLKQKENAIELLHQRQIDCRNTESYPAEMSTISFSNPSEDYRQSEIFSKGQQQQPPQHPLDERYLQRHCDIPQYPETENSDSLIECVYKNSEVQAQSNVGNNKNKSNIPRAKNQTCTRPSTNQSTGRRGANNNKQHRSADVDSKSRNAARKP